MMERLFLPPLSFARLLPVARGAGSAPGLLDFSAGGGVLLCRKGTHMGGNATTVLGALLVLAGLYLIFGMH